LIDCDAASLAMVGLGLERAWFEVRLAGSFLCFSFSFGLHGERGYPMCTWHSHIAAFFLLSSITLADSSPGWLAWEKWIMFRRAQSSIRFSLCCQLLIADLVVTELILIHCATFGILIIHPRLAKLKCPCRRYTSMNPLLQPDDSIIDHHAQVSLLTKA